MPPTIIAIWIAGAAISDGYSRAVTSAFKKTAAKRLRNQVQQSTNVHVPARRFYEWFGSATSYLGTSLVHASEAQYQSLRTSLMVASLDPRRGVSSTPKG